MKRKPIIQLAFFAGLCFTLVLSCKYDEVLPFHVDPGVEVFFSQDILPIFENKCASSGCHNGSGAPPDLRSSVAYDNLSTKGYINIETPDQSKLYLWMSEALGPMPPLGANATDNALVLQWITQGGKNN
ncbi:MAG: hypothetical protein WBP41_18770 [Saprospiraceae bacterium]